MDGLRKQKDCWESIAEQKKSRESEGTWLPEKRECTLPEKSSWPRRKVFDGKLYGGGALFVRRGNVGKRGASLD